MPFTSTTSPSRWIRPQRVRVICPLFAGLRNSTSTQSTIALLPISVAAIGGDYVLAYTSREHDNSGDLYALRVPRMAGESPGTPLALDTNALKGAANPRVAAYGPRELGAYVVVYNDNEPVPDPLFVSVGLTPPSEVDSLLLMTRGERYGAVAAAPYELTGGSVWFGYTAQVVGGRVGAVVFQLPPP